MKAMRRIFPMIAPAVVLLVTLNSGRATEQAGIPSFHRVLVVNDKARPVAAEVQSGLITAIVEMQQEDGRWRAVGKLRAPAGACSSTRLSDGEIWQFIIPDFGSGLPAKVRLAVGTSGQTIYSQPFRANVDPLKTDIHLECWLARIRPAPSEQGPIIAAVESKPAR
ncbi:MAG: hypothetical protein ACKOB0_10325 [Chthoniobacterales bacterium]